MSVILNEAALAVLLETEAGPVGRFVERVSARVVENAQSNVRGYFHTAPTLNVDRDIGLQMQGSSGVVGIRDAGPKAQLLARYQAHGNSNGVVDWLLEALNQTEAEHGT